MDRSEGETPANPELAEVRQAAELRVGDRLAFAYDGRIGMLLVRAEPGKRVALSTQWVWGQVTGVSEELWRSYPVIADRRMVWVLCGFGDQSSIVKGIPYGVAIVPRPSAS
ncbi:hypothetical protein [Streptosporangium sp. NPDC006007]|uniref:hypothetical protein n=1 Tax=Streptosporangium sp. NPDC006007 TaxID=3154575 RepID=UPI00339E2484